MYNAGEFLTGQPAVTTMTSLQQQQQPAVQVPVRPASIVEGEVDRQSVVLGVLLMTLALLSATFNIVDLVVTFDSLMPRGYCSSAADICHGLWAGLLVRIPPPLPTAC